MRSDRPSWGLLGVGDFAAEVVVPSMASVIQIDAVASRNPIKAEALGRQVQASKIYDSYEALLSDKDISHVYIGVPTTFHALWSKKALMSGKTVLCEKPFSLDTTEASDFWSELQSDDLAARMHVGWMYRYHPRWNRIRELLIESHLGEVTSMVFYYSYRDTGDNPRRHDLSYGGGALALVGCYGIHIAQQLLGSVPMEATSARYGLDGESVDVLSVVSLGYTKAAACITSDLRSPFSQFLRINGTEGWLDVPMPINPGPDEKTLITGHSRYSGRLKEVIAAHDQFALQALAIESRPEDRDTLMLDIVEHSALLERLLNSPLRQLGE